MNAPAVLAVIGVAYAIGVAVVLWMAARAEEGFEHPQYGWLPGKPENYIWPPDDPYAVLNGRRDQ